MWRAPDTGRCLFPAQLYFKQYPGLPQNSVKLSRDFPQRSGGEISPNAVGYLLQQMRARVSGVDMQALNNEVDVSYDMIRAAFDDGTSSASAGGAPFSGATGAGAGSGPSAGAGGFTATAGTAGSSGPGDGLFPVEIPAVVHLRRNIVQELLARFPLISGNRAVTETATQDVLNQLVFHLHALPSAPLAPASDVFVPDMNSATIVDILAKQLKRHYRMKDRDARAAAAELSEAFQEASARCCSGSSELHRIVVDRLGLRVSDAALGMKCVTRGAVQELQWTDPTTTTTTVHTIKFSTHVLEWLNAK